MTIALHRVILLTLLSPALVFAADTNSSSEATVAAAIETYWDARNNNDHKTVASMESKTGTLGTNSDGSFHKPLAKASADDWKRNMSGNKGNVRVFYTEATEISEGVVYARYYGEGVIGTEGDLSPYRTRITNVWVKEADGEWRMKAMHFSPANFGGTHKTQRSDFDD